MAAGTSTIRFLSAGAAGRVKKQLNDLYLHMSFKIHQELANLGVIAVRAAGTAAAPLAGVPRANGLATAASDANILRFISTNPNSETAKDWEANVQLWGAAEVAGTALANAVQVGRPKLDQTIGDRVLVVVDSPVAGDVNWDVSLKIGAIRLSDVASKISETFTLTGTPAAGTIVVTVAGGSTAGTTVTLTGTPTLGAVATAIADAVNLGADANRMSATAATDAISGAVTVTFVSDGDVTVTPAVGTGVTAASGGPSVAGALPVGTNVPFSTYTFTITKGAGIGQAMAFVDDAGQVVEDIVAIDWNSLAAGLAPSGLEPAMKGAHRGVSIKIMSVPREAVDAAGASDWIYHAFVRQINPNIPKDYREVADHFDGAADTIRAIAIPSLGIQKVFENVPGSFMNLRTRRVTMRADVKENNRFDASEVHYFLGVKGTPTVTFNNDNESISAMECIMYRWITLS